MDKSICIIPARGGSKRIPRKNIKPFLGKPIIAYSIETALRSKLFDTVMVSTDDEEISEVAQSYGAEVPFLRSNQTADDTATTMSVLVEVVREYERIGKTFDAICCLYAAAPLVQQKDLIAGHSMYEHAMCDTVLPVVRYSYPIWRGLQLTQKGEVEMVWPENIESRTQDLEPVFHDAGQWYWIASDSIGIPTFKSNCRAIEISEEYVQDIDSDTDWTLAEIKYQYLLKQGKILSY